MDKPPLTWRLGVIDLPTIQRYLNFHYGVTLDLSGSDISSNAATFHARGIKGLYQEDRIKGDHALHDDTYPVLEVSGDQLVAKEAPALNALNERLRDDFHRGFDLGCGGVEQVDSEVRCELHAHCQGVLSAGRAVGGGAGVGIQEDPELTRLRRRNVNHACAGRHNT
jgi:hypothetical protein